MKTRYKFLLIIIFAAIIFGSGFYLGNKEKAAYKKVPHSFSITFEQDNSSGSGNRNSSGDLFFKNDMLTSGFIKYNASTIGSTVNYTCLVKDQTLVDQDTGIPCQATSPVSLSRNGIIDQIKNNLLKTLDICEHGDICYKIHE